ncbi:hypothetical protein ASD65_10425 [Microbacterium sp. Root61]|nr:hypothetical protein ASD65_10425 [Microbacterium sp. Root61]
MVGGGLMGRGISAALARAGLDVMIVEPDEATADLIRAEAVPGRHLVTLEDGLRGADIVIEAITEHPEAKRELWRRMGGLAGPDTVLASNTSSLSIDDLAAQVEHPERVAGMHWFTPAELIRCVEVVRGASTSDDTVAAVFALARRAGKGPVTVADSPGFIANRLQFALLAEALRCVEEGVATPAQVDEIVRTSFGPRLAVLGPFANADLGGLDVYASILRQLHDGVGAHYPASGMLQEHVEHGRLGVKAGAGFADYTPDSAAALRAHRDGTLRAVIALVSAQAKTGLDDGPWASGASDTATSRQPRESAP